MTDLTIRQILRAGALCSAIIGIAIVIMTLGALCIGYMMRVIGWVLG